MVKGVGAEIIEKKKEADRMKTFKNEKKKTRKEKWRIQGKPNNKNKHIWFYLLCKNFIVPQNIVWRKVVYGITFYLQFLYVARYLKHSNGTPKSSIYINIQIII